MNDIPLLALAFYFAKAYCDSNPDVGANFGNYQERTKLARAANQIGLEISDEEIDAAINCLINSGMMP
jgi:hypothetical protein